MPILALLTMAAAATYQSPLVSRAEPIGSPGSWISTRDYPAEALRRAAQGTVGFRLEIDANGRPVDCDVTQTSGDRTLDDTTCALVLARARFRPARDENGTATHDTFSSRIRWVAESPLLIRQAPVHIVNTLMSEPVGLVTCSVSMNDEPPPSGIGFGCDIDYDHMQVRRFAARFRGRIVQLLDSISLVPGSEPGPSQNREPLGDLYFHQEVHLDIAPNGSVSECRTLSRTRGQTDGPTPPNVCIYYRRMGPTMFAATPGAEGSRPIRVTHDYYVRVMQPGDPKP